MAGMSMQGHSRVALTAAVLACSLQWSCRTSSPRPTAEPTDVWFDQLGEPLALGPAEATALLARARQAAFSPTTDAQAVALPASLRDDVEPRIVFLSASDGGRPATVTLGAGRGIARALGQASDRLRQAHRASAPRWLALDVVTEVGRVQRVSWDQPIHMARGLDGLAFAAGSGVAFTAQELLGRRLVTRELEMKPERMAVWAKSRIGVRDRAIFDYEGKTSVRTFASQTFFDSGTGVRELFRGHVRARPVSDEMLRQAVITGAGYLAREVDVEGRFTYSYLAKQGRAKDSYNMVRHAGTVYSMFEAYELTGDAELLATAERALAYMLEYIAPYGAPKADMAALAYNGKIKLGGVALAALALATHARVTGTRTHLATAQRLCRYIAGNQRADGSFVHQRSSEDGRELPFVSQYYPEEALLGLASVYRLDRDPGWLDTAEAGARFLIEIRDRGVPTPRLTHDHWLLYALERLHLERANPLYLTHAMRIAEAITGAQRRTGLTEDQIGGYADVEPRATPIATRNEGLMAAYRMARAVGDLAMAAKILAAVELGNEVVMAMRVNPSRALYLENPKRALGGVTRSYQNFEIRIDYVQHSISAWLALLRARQAKAPD